MSVETGPKGFLVPVWWLFTGWRLDVCADIEDVSGVDAGRAGILLGFAEETENGDGVGAANGADGTGV